MKLLYVKANHFKNAKDNFENIFYLDGKFDTEMFCECMRYVQQSAASELQLISQYTINKIE